MIGNFTKSKPSSDFKEVRCPVCDKKLFNISATTSATVSVKCPRCKTCSVIDITALVNEHHSS